MKIIVMLLWLGVGNGGGATIQGFASTEACERARPAVDAGYGQINVPVRSRCVALSNEPASGARPTP